MNMRTPRQLCAEAVQSQYPSVQLYMDSLDGACYRAYWHDDVRCLWVLSDDVCCENPTFYVKEYLDKDYIS